MSEDKLFWMVCPKCKGNNAIIKMQCNRITKEVGLDAISYRPVKKEAFICTIWRPPYEIGSLLIEVTAESTHYKCKIYTLYDNFPFKFRMSPLEDVEADLLEAQI